MYMFDIFIALYLIIYVIVMIYYCLISTKALFAIQVKLLYAGEGDCLPEIRLHRENVRKKTENLCFNISTGFRRKHQVLF